MKSWQHPYGLGVTTVIATAFVAVPSATAEGLNVESSRCLREDCISAFSSTTNEPEEHQLSEEDLARIKVTKQRADEAQRKLEDLKKSGASAEEIKAAEENHQLTDQELGELYIDINVKSVLRDEDAEQKELKEKRLSLLAASGFVALVTATLAALAQAAGTFLPQLKAALSL